MNLKEAFRYSNHLDSLLMSAEMYLANSTQTVEVTQTHHRSKVDPEATDEVITSEKLYPNRGTHFPVDDVIGFMFDVLQEKIELSSEINNAKRFASFQLDHQLACNKAMQRIAHRLGNLANTRITSHTLTGTGRRFNAEGNQITYSYDIEEVQALAFDKDEVRRASKEMLAKADEISNQAECFMLETVVSLEPSFSVNDSFEESMEIYIRNKK